MKKLVILGAGGHGKVVADIAVKNGYEEIVFLDDNKTSCAGFSVVGK
ncbi:PglD-related sugar-binding protein, partial [Ligilactobacillus salivarius]